MSKRNFKIHDFQSVWTRTNLRIGNNHGCSCGNNPFLSCFTGLQNNSESTDTMLALACSHCSLEQWKTNLSEVV